MESDDADLYDIVTRSSDTSSADSSEEYQDDDEDEEGASVRPSGSGQASAGRAGMSGGQFVGLSQTCGLRTPERIRPRFFVAQPLQPAREDASVESFRVIQANTLRRSLLAAQFARRLRFGPWHRCSPAQVNSRLVLTDKLGSGTYGNVCEVSLASGDPPFPLALKRVDTEDVRSAYVVRDENLYSSNLREIQASRMLSELVTSNSSPNFVMLYGFCTGGVLPTTASSLGVPEHEEDTPYVDTFVEIAESDLSRWASEARSTDEWMAVAFQVASALCYMARVYGMVHNDLYLRNLLVNAVRTREGMGDVVYRYALWAAGSQSPDNYDTYFVRTSGWLAKVSDLGFATIGRRGTAGHHLYATILNPGPDDLVLALPDRRAWRTMARGKHVLYHRYLNPYARDISVFLSELYLAPRAPPAVTTWACAALDEIWTAIDSRPARDPLMGFTTGESTAYSSPDELIDTVVHIFSPWFLQDAGLDPDTFARRPSDRVEQSFELPRLDEEVITFSAPERSDYGPSGCRVGA